jgi:hypothetical protein
MNRLFINGIAIELDSKIEFSFEFHNSLFNIGSINLLRTQSFKIPKTPNNDIAFGFARFPEFKGDFFRLKHNAIMYYSGGFINGQVIILSFQDDNYNCSFVEMSDKIKNIIDSGLISDYLKTSVSDIQRLIYATLPVLPNNPSSLSTVYGLFNYTTIYNDAVFSGRVTPSVRTEFLIERISQYFNIRIIGFPTGKYFIKTNKYETLPYMGNYYINLSTNLPNVDTLEFLKTLAYIAGGGIIFRNDTVKFHDYSFDSVPIKIDNLVIKVKEIKRSIDGYAMNNFIEFSSNTYVGEASYPNFIFGRVIKNIQVQNENINENNTLYTSPLSETSRIRGGTQALTREIKNYDTQFTPPYFTMDEGQNPEIMQWNGGNQNYLSQIEFIDNQNLLNILEKQTQIIIQIFMYQFQFFAINEETTFQYRNKKFAVINAKWQKNIAELTLILID